MSRIGYVGKFRAVAALILSLLSGVASLAVGTIGIGGLLFFGVGGSGLDKFFVLGPFIPFPLFLLSLRSIRLSALAMWIFSFVYWLVVVLGSLPALSINPFDGTMSDMRLTAALLMTAAYLVVSLSSGGRQAQKGDINLIMLTRTES